MSSNSIRKIKIVEAYSDRGPAGIEATVITENGTAASSLCTGGLSVGPYELKNAYDNTERFDGKGLQQAAERLNTCVVPKLIGMDVTDQNGCDAVIASVQEQLACPIATTALSEAILKAGAKTKGVPLYRYIAEVSGTERFLMPLPSHQSASGSVRYGGSPDAGDKPTYSFVAYDYPSWDEASYALWELMTDYAEMMSKKMDIRMSLDNPFGIPVGRISGDSQLLDLMAEAIRKRGAEGKIGIQVDLAAGQFYDRESGLYKGLFREKPFTRDELIRYEIELTKAYPIVIMEDPLEPDDFEGFAAVTAGSGIQIVGDELFSTDMERLRRGIAAKAANSILIVPTHCGTVSKAFAVARLAKENGYGLSVCGSRGEGVEICDYAVGLGCETARECGLSFTGNRLMQIQSELAESIAFPGIGGLKQGCK